MDDKLKNELMKVNSIEAAKQHCSTVLNFDGQIIDLLNDIKNGNVDNDVLYKARNCILNMKNSNTASNKTLGLIEEAFNAAEMIFKRSLELELSRIKQ